MSLLETPILLKTRRNHALEHATLHLLAEKYPNRSMGGYSTASGFFILGSLSQEDVQRAASEALERLRNGESHLAIHPGCGTNLALSLLAAWIAFRAALYGNAPMRKKLWRLPFALAFSLAAYTLSRPLGPLAQAYITTEANVGETEILAVAPLRVKQNAYRIWTKAA